MPVVGFKTLTVNEAILSRIDSHKGTYHKRTAVISRALDLLDQQVKHEKNTASN